MKDLARAFLSQAEKEKIKAAVAAAEKKTAGEIVPMVVSASYHYPMSNVIGAVTFSLPLALLLTPLAGGWFWIGSWNLWIFLGLFTLLFILGHAVVKRTPGLKRLFISEREIEEEVEEAAVTGFFEEGLYRTRDETGILIFISVFEHRVKVMADRGISRRVDQERWDDIVSHIVKGIKENRQAGAICEAVATVGNLLAAHFPARPDDEDELQDLIVKT
ncbi:MAG: TPM domain-containing protein [Desulfosarcina sp.]|nr:TPM domain-containing protein [Desulfobacterales bacterium]